MYVIYTLNKFIIKVLRRDPKRNYKKSRIFFFYFKVFINTLKNYKKYSLYKAKIVYVTKSKEIHFTKSNVYVKYFDNRIQKKYLFLLKNKIISDYSFKNGFLRQPFYEITQINVPKLDLLEKVVNSHLNSLYSLKLFLSVNYFSALEKRVLKIKINEADKKLVDEIFPVFKKKEIYKSIAHGDLWLGNILMIDNQTNLIDWDDLSFKSFSYDLFYFYFQEYKSDFYSFYKDYDLIKTKILPIFMKTVKKFNMKISDTDYLDYYNVFLLERLLHRYEK